MKPEDAAAHVNLGLLYLKMKQPREAVGQLERAVELEPTSRIARQALADARRITQEDATEKKTVSP